MSPGPAARPLTVVQVLPALEAGGVERGTLEVAAELVRRGHRSLVVAAGGRLAERLVAEGSAHIPWDVGAKHPRTLRRVPHMRGLLRDVRPDVLHLRSRLPAWVGYLAWRSLPAAARPHLVTTVHGPYSVNRYSAVMTRGERVIAISRTIERYVLEHYPRVDPGRVRLIHRGVDPAAFPRGYRPPAEWLARWREQQPQLAGRFVVTLPARLTRWKGQEDLLEVVAALRREDVPVHALVVGGADPRRRGYEAELRRGIDARGLGGEVTLTGHRDDLREILAVSDAVLSLAREPEAFGRTTLEALSLGRPVAGYDHGGVGEQLAAAFPEGRVPPGDTVALAALLARWQRHGAPAPRVPPFTLQRMLDATLDLYLELARPDAAQAAP